MSPSAPSLGTYAITGIQAGVGPEAGRTPIRQEIDTWAYDEANAIQVDLFIQALIIFQATEPEEKLSWFRIAAIHGIAPNPWDEETKTQNDGANNGYCTHNTNLFVTWHRPYVILFEQILYNIMRTDIIPQYPQDVQKELIKHADTWRVPFWDWAAKRPDPENPKATPSYDVPKFVRLKRISISVPTGGTTEVDNPLNAFTTEEEMGRLYPDMADAIDYIECYATSRAPQNKAEILALTGAQNNDLVKEALNRPLINEDYLGEAVYRLLSQGYHKTYDEFATTASPTNTEKGQYLSVESLHNNIHNYCGGSGSGGVRGHMGSEEVAAFDPIFWLHHGNVDRLLAIWQTLYSETWFDPLYRADVSLAPFHTNSEGTYYTSNKCREWTQYGYTYPELQRWKFVVDGKVDEEAYKDDIRTRLNELYRPGYINRYRLGELDDYVVNVKYERFALEGEAFTVQIYIDQNEVGQVYNFSSPLRAIGGPVPCENCQEQQNNHAVATGEVPITAALLHIHKNPGQYSSGNLASLRTQDVKPYLRKSLNWKVIKENGEEVALSDIPSLRVTVSVGKAVHPPSGTFDGETGRPRFSVYSDYEVLN